MRRYLLIGITFVVSIAVLVPVALASTHAPGDRFTDDDGNVHEGAIEAIAAEEITVGCNPPDGDHFCPSDFVTREQMAAFLARAEALTDTGDGDYFTDDDGSVHETDIDRIAAAGITVGCSISLPLYCPSDLVTREQMASFIARARGFTDPPLKDHFVDDETSSHEDDINRIADAGITLGCQTEPARYCPFDFVRRDEMASFLARALGLTIDPPSTRPDVKLETVISEGLSQPVFLTAPTDDNRLFIVERAGRIRIFDGGSLNATPFLDITSSVSGKGERGLLGMAFHPDYSSNGQLYVQYSKSDIGCPSHRTVIAEYRVSAGDPDIADSTERVIISMCQPTGSHNGGMLAFGPDGNLFIGLGDGGPSWDGSNNAQNRNTLLGAMLRLDVDGATPYAIPADNPFVGVDGADEIFAMGLRNPWRFSIDGDMMYVGDVGQEAREEIDVFSATNPGLNFGWPRFEGNTCVEDRTSETTCDAAGMTFPVLEHFAPQSDSITGGYVYRGSALGEFGHYFYGDFSDGWIKSALIIDGIAYNEKDWTSTFGSEIGLVSFGVDGHGELYVVNYFGSIKKFVPDV